MHPLHLRFYVNNGVELNFLQENSLYMLKMAVNFVNEQSARNVSAIDNTTKNLIQGAALILSSASEDKNEKVKYQFLLSKNSSMKVSKKCGLTTRGLDFGSRGEERLRASSRKVVVCITVILQGLYPELLKTKSKNITLEADGRRRDESVRNLGGDQ